MASTIDALRSSHKTSLVLLCGFLNFLGALQQTATNSAAKCSPHTETSHLTKVDLSLSENDN